MSQLLERNEIGMNEDKLNAFMEKMLSEASVAYTAPLVVLGDRLGLYKAMAGAGPLTPAELAKSTGTDERYLREWLGNQAASGYVEYHADTGRYSLPAEHAMALADEDSPIFIQGGFEIVAAMFRSAETMEKAFRSGHGVGWHEHDGCLHRGVDRIFRPSYLASLVSSWIPSLQGVEDKLKTGALVADTGCGFGSSTIIMAQAYPESTFVGFDFHPESIEKARRKAEDAGLSDRVSFEVASAAGYPGKGYDLVTMFDALHDMGDPIGAAEHVRDTLSPDGTWMIVEPYAGDTVSDNLNPVGRMYYAASTMICTPGSRAQEVGMALGAQAGEARLRDVVTRGGFRHFRRAAETPLNLVFEARP